jgi:hypothetical protein
MLVEYSILCTAYKDFAGFCLSDKTFSYICAAKNYDYVEKKFSIY